MALFDKFLSFLDNENLIDDGDYVLLAVSGGPDSLAMFDLFRRAEMEMDMELAVFHLNHCLRKEAAEDAEFVASLCAQYNIRAFIEEVDVGKFTHREGLSPEEGARKVRFLTMARLVREHMLDRVSLGHNKNDLVETVLLNLFRGSGLRGLRGIDPLSRWQEMVIIHPLLPFSRREIEDYCQSRGLTPRRDRSNEKLIYTRNIIRHRLFPVIEEINSAAGDNIFRMSKILRKEDKYLDQLAAEKLNDLLIEKDNAKIVVSLPGLRQQHQVLLRRILREIIAILKINPVDLYSNHIQIVENLIFRGRTGNIIELPDDIWVKRSYDKVIFRRGKFEIGREEFKVRFVPPGEFDLPYGYRLSCKIESNDGDWLQDALKKKVCVCDRDKVNFPLFARSRKKGDRFQPLGMEGNKKIKDFLIDEKVPAETRDEIPLIVDSDDNIIWVAGLRMGEKFKVRDKTETLLKMELKREENNNDRNESGR